MIEVCKIHANRLEKYTHTYNGSKCVFMVHTLLLVHRIKVCLHSCTLTHAHTHKHSHTMHQKHIHSLVLAGHLVSFVTVYRSREQAIDFQTLTNNQPDVTNREWPNFWDC